MIRAQFLFRFFQRSNFFRAAFLSFFLILIFGEIIHLLEPAQFPSLFDGIWWAVITISTVGYGDAVPQSVIGKAVNILLILFGTGFFATYFVKLSAIAASRESAYLAGSLPYKGKHHIILIGWNERVKAIVEQYTNSSNDTNLVLIDSSLPEKPLVSPNLYFIKGNATHSHILQRANIAYASKALITADPSKNEELADMQTILTLIAIKGLNPQLYTIAEILTKTQEQNAKYAGANAIISTNILTGQKMYGQLFSDT